MVHVEACSSESGLWCQGAIITSSRNGYEAMFMNILVGLIFVFQLPITFFLHERSIPLWSSNLLFLLVFISSLLLAVVSEDTESFTPGVSQCFQIILNLTSLSHKASVLHH